MMKDAKLLGYNESKFKFQLIDVHIFSVWHTL